MKVQYKSEKLSIKSDKRYLLYRIDPSELSWWKRKFKNPWKYAFYKSYNFVMRYDNSINDCLKFLFTAKEAQEFVEKYDTYEKLIDFLETEYKKASNMYHEAQEKYNKENKWEI